MRKSLIKSVLFLLFLVNISYAATAIKTPGHPVQCNKWGWVYDNYQTVWNNSCTPLEVQVGTNVVSVATTEGACPRPDQYAIYQLSHDKTRLELQYCK